MLTRCPHCTTTFRVKPEQLKARLGRVRCGQCQTVFNALDSLVEEMPAVPVSAPVPMEVASVPEATVDAPPEPASSEPAVVPETVFEAADRASAEEATPAVAEPEEPAVEVVPTPEPAPADVPATPETESVAEQVPEPVDEPAVSPESDNDSIGATEAMAEPDATEEVEPKQEAEAEPAPQLEPGLPSDLDFTITEPLSAAIEAETVTDAVVEAAPETEAPVTLEPTLESAPTAPTTEEEPAVADHEPLLHQAPRSPRRWPWAALAVLASLLLMGQALFQYRVEVAVFAPALKPLLKAACEPLGCDVPRPRKADLLDIESSDLHPGKTKGRLELVAVLKNKAPFSQELPVLELSLTDTADRPLIIKALQPADYLPPGRKPTAGFPAKGEINVNLTLDAGDTPAAGYRLYLYYP